MKKNIILLIMLLPSFINVIPQKIIPKIEIKQLEKQAICKMRKLFDIPKEEQLFATVLFEVLDSTQTYSVSPTFEKNKKICNYLERLKIIHYEIFVYDSELKSVFVVNRVFLGKGRYKKRYYVGKEDDFIISTFLLKNNYDYVLNLIDAPSQGNKLVLLCCKNTKMDLAFLKDETIKSRPVCNEDTFIFGE